jgi:hypothetical protein
MQGLKARSESSRTTGARGSRLTCAAADGPSADLRMLRMGFLFDSPAAELWRLARYMTSRFLELARKTFALILGAIFGILALIDWAQVLLALLGHSDNPSALIALHFGTGAAAAATCWGSWRKTRWTPIAAVAYGALTAALLLALPSLLNLPLDARAGLRAGAAGVLLFALLSAAYFRADSRQRARQISTERANER